MTHLQGLFGLTEAGGQQFLATRYSLLATRYSLLATRYSLLSRILAKARVDIAAIAVAARDYGAIEPVEHGAGHRPPRTL